MMPCPAAAAQASLHPLETPCFETAVSRASMSEVVSSSPMHEEQKAHDEQRHKEIILGDHDALLSPFRSN